MLHEAGFDPPAAMEIVSRTDYQTTANICTHPNNETPRHAGVDPEGVFDKKAGSKAPKNSKDARSRKPAADNPLP